MQITLQYDVPNDMFQNMRMCVSVVTLSVNGGYNLMPCWIAVLSTLSKCTPMYTYIIPQCTIFVFR